MPKELLVDKIYDALKEAARGDKEVTINRGVAAASAVTNMSRGLTHHWLDTMHTLGMINMNGITIWLSKDYGPRVRSRSPEEKAIIEGQKVPPKAIEHAKKVLEK